MVEKQFSASSRLRDLNRSTTNIPSACRIANIAINDAMILPYDANLARIEFSERTPRPERGFHTQKSEIIAGFGFRYTQVPNTAFAPRQNPLRCDRRARDSRPPRCGAHRARASAPLRDRAQAEGCGGALECM